jgi:threonine/homoserine/homoserine lactone efflux protein
MDERRDELVARAALGIGFVLGAVNPKNLALSAAGMSSVLDATDVPREQAAAIAIFAIVSSLSIAVPIVLGATGGPRIKASLTRTGDWMTTHGKTISVVVLAAIAVVLIVGGVRVLLQ